MRRKIIALAILVLLLGTVLAAVKATKSYFTSQAKVQNNVFSTGEWQDQIED
jgi:hypothetical protein